jgi:hypothetical protein
LNLGIKMLEIIFCISILCIMSIMSEISLLARLLGEYRGSIDVSFFDRINGICRIIKQKER